MERRLAAILAADMVGFSRLMEADEVGTLTRQKRHRAELIDPRIEAHGGKIIKLTGDGMIAEFPSVVEAVQCAVTIQREMDAREADESEDRRICYRIAVNLGDVIFDEGDVYGDGVNIAARLEAMADPGGVLVSGSAYDQLKANIDVGYEDLGERQVKNIETPVRVYRVVPGGTGTVARKLSTRGRLPVLAAVAVIALLIAGGAWWWWSERPEFTPADPSKMQYALEEPSIAVLAFDNLTGDPEQEHVSDGISEDIIATLARLPGLVVIARNSSFSYKGKPVDVRTIAEDLSVRYVLEGSVQKSSDRLRVTAQLVDAVSGHHVWSNLYNRPSADLLSVKDEILQKIVEELNRNLLEGDVYWANVDSFKTTEAWLLARRADWHRRQSTRADNEISIDIAHEILSLEPDSVWAYSVLSWRHGSAARFRWSDDREVSLQLAEQYAETALELDDRDPNAIGALAWVRFNQGQFEEAIELGERALEVAPGDTGALSLLAIYYQKNMQAKQAIELFQRTIRVDKNAPTYVWENYGESLVMDGNYERALKIYKEALRRGIKGFSKGEVHLGMAISYDAVDEPDKSRKQITKAISEVPRFNMKFLREFAQYRDPNYQERWLKTLKRLGMPEG